ncbi:MAG: hypothetical protein MHPSP_000070 [Paramarteilia canceri]
MTKSQLLQMFHYNEYKKQVINSKIADGSTTTVYKCGTLVDLCLGPHVRNTGFIKAFRLLNNGASHWHVGGISLLMDMLRKQYRLRGFSEIITPNIYKTKLWEISGHLKHYQENMFRISTKLSQKSSDNSQSDFESDSSQYGLKPMNCPGHCLLFKQQLYSYKDLPIRFADFGALHRNEASGALVGLTRVIRFQQDDAHIFCTMEQIGSEIEGCIDFLKYVYNLFGFNFDLELSTRPESFIGTIENWNKAEKTMYIYIYHIITRLNLEDVLNKYFGAGKWKINEGDGAFYGPKIDIHVKDAKGKSFQLATIQLDFTLPERFDLVYIDDQNIKQRPVMIHRAILGTFERCLGVLAENYSGKWPLWLSPRQIALLPINQTHNKLAEKILQAALEDYPSLCIEILPPTSSTVSARIRTAQVLQFNLICVIGNRELENGSVSVRGRNNSILGEFPIESFIKKVHFLASSYVKDADLKMEEYLKNPDFGKTSLNLQSIGNCI